MQSMPNLQLRFPSQIWELLKDICRRKALGLVAEWASIHKEELMENWKSLSENGPGTFKKIEPLK
jgi:DNA-binding phage protein